MKKILIFIVAIVCCCGCSSDVDVVKHIETHNTNIGSFNYIQYDGHEYLIWKSRGYAGGITHSPNCHCQNK